MMTVAYIVQRRHQNDDGNWGPWHSDPVDPDFPERHTLSLAIRQAEILNHRAYLVEYRVARVEVGPVSHFVEYTPTVTLGGDPTWWPEDER